MSKDYMKDHRIDYGKSLEKVMSDNGISFRYRGVIAKRQFGGLLWSNNWYSSERLFKEAVDRAYGSLSKSINRLKK